MSENLLEKWEPVLNAEGQAPITDTAKSRVLAQLLETQELNESASAVDANVAQYNPVMISMLRRLAPQLIAFDIMGVQALTLPTGLIFCLKARYSNGAGAEAMGVNEVNTGFSGTGTQQALDPINTWAATYGTAIDTATAEVSTSWASMGMTIDKVTATAQTRQLRADYSLELEQDLKTVHGLSAESELINILSNEITAEINREAVRSIYKVAKLGANWVGISTPGTFDLSTDSDGRYNVEKFKGLYFAIQRDANRIAIESRRGRGNLVIVSADIASALALAGVLTYAPALDAMIKIDADPSGVTYVGMLGSMKVYIDPFLGFDAYVVGYKGANQYDAGIFYCPYQALQLYKATDPVTFQPALGFKTRYAMIENPFVHQTPNTLQVSQNYYYRKVVCTSLSNI